MPDVEVITEEIRAAGDAAAEAAEEVRRIDVGAVGDAAAAIPGSRAADLFRKLEKHLATNFDRAAEGFGAIGDAMHDAADLYEQNEHAAAAAMAVPYAPELGI